MSAAPRFQSELGYAGLRMTADDFFTIGETDERLELVHGVVVMSPRPAPLHQTMLRLILRQLDRYLEDHLGAACFPQVDCELSVDTVYAPDIACYAPGRLKGIPSRLTSPPDLIVEVLNARRQTFDLITKRDDYDRFGVAEYWAADPDASDVRCWQRKGSRLCETPPEGDALGSTAFPGLVLDLRPLRQIATTHGRKA